MKDSQQLVCIKVIGVIFAFIIMGVAFLIGMLEGVIESSMLVTSATSGPLLGVFIMAILIPVANWKVSKYSSVKKWGLQQLIWSHN